MTDKRDKIDDLESFFAAARRDTPEPGDDFLARIIADEARAILPQAAE